MNNGGKEGGERKWEFVRSLGGRGEENNKKRVKICWKSGLHKKPSTAAPGWSVLLVRAAIIISPLF